MKLRLASRAVRGEPQNQWAALRAAHEKVGQISESQILVGNRGFEPLTFSTSKRCSTFELVALFQVGAGGIEPPTFRL